MSEYYKNIKKALLNLPGEEAHQEMIPFRALSSSYKTEIENAKQSAVMCLMVPKNNAEHHIILIERQHDGGKHSGQISFPGGKKDLTDKNLEETALRETEEEIGIKPSQIQILGELTEVYIPVSNFLVQPFVGVVHSSFEFTLSENEVKSVFTFDTNQLLLDQTKTQKDILNHKGVKMKNIPCFEIDNKIVWGATALMLNEFKAILKTLG